MKAVPFVRELINAPPLLVRCVYIFGKRYHKYLKICTRQDL